MSDQQRAGREDEKRYQIQADANYAAHMESERRSRKDILDEAVEAAAKVHQDALIRSGRLPWEGLSPTAKAHRLERMQAALEAVRAHILPEAN